MYGEQFHWFETEGAGTQPTVPYRGPVLTVTRNHLYWPIELGPWFQPSIQTPVPLSTEKYQALPGVELRLRVVFMYDPAPDRVLHAAIAGASSVKNDPRRAMATAIARTACLPRGPRAVSFCLIVKVSGRGRMFARSFKGSFLSGSAGRKASAVIASNPDSKPAGQGSRQLSPATDNLGHDGPSRIGLRRADRESGPRGGL